MALIPNYHEGPIKANDMQDVFALKHHVEEQVKNWTEVQRSWFAAGIVYNNLMAVDKSTTLGIKIGLFFTRVYAWIMRHPAPTLIVGWYALFFHFPLYAEHTIEVTLTHLIIGLDMIDIDSFGGFSQGEMDKFIYLFVSVDNMEK